MVFNWHRWLVGCSMMFIHLIHYYSLLYVSFPIALWWWFLMWKLNCYLHSFHVVFHIYVAQELWLHQYKSARLWVIFKTPKFIIIKKSFSSQLPIIVLKCYSETVIHLFIFIALTFSLWEILGFEKVSRAKQQCEISNNDKIDKTQAILKPGKYIFIKFVTQKAIVLPFISAIPFIMPPKCERTYFMSYSTRNSHNISYYNISHILLTPKK